MGAATFANSSSGQTQYVDISATTEAPVLVSGGYLYINKGYTDNLKISLAKLVPDGASADLASGVILSGYAAYDNDGNLVAGNIPTKSSANIEVAGPTVSIPSGYYGTAVSTNVAIGTLKSQVNGSFLPIFNIDNNGLITVENNRLTNTYPITNTGYLEYTKELTVVVSGTSSYQLDTQAAATITPTESSQTAVASGKYTTGTVTVGAISSNYVGSNIPARSSSNLSASGSIITAAAGYYANSASKAVAAGSVSVADTSVTLSRNNGLSLNVGTDGYISATVSSAKIISPTVTEGYVSSGTSGTVSITGSISAQM